MITYDHITQSSYISYQYNHIETYRYICNNCTLISFQTLSILVSFQPKFTYETITQPSYISYQFNHTEAYRCICNHGTLILFQPPVYWFHFNQNDYMWIYNLGITHIISIPSCITISTQQFQIHNIQKQLLSIKLSLLQFILDI